MRVFTQKRASLVLAVAATLLGALLPAVAAADDPVEELVPGTNVLLSQSDSSGNGGNTSSTSSRTNIFSPAAYVDYKRFGGEPTVTVDRYPFPGTSTNAAAQCPSGQTSCFKDTIYASSPNGFAYPHFSPFWKSDDRGETFRVPCHTAPQGQTCATGGGGGDSHTAVGQKTHRLFFVDLPGPGCVTNNISDDLGETFVGDNVGCGQNPGSIDDRQWVEADEEAPLPAGNMGNVYISFINFTNLAAPALSLARSTHDGDTGTFVTDSVCNTLNAQTPNGTAINPLPTTPAPDATPTPCPDPADVNLQIAGPPVADRNGTASRPASHNVYIPFVRGTPLIPGLTSGPPYSLWIAKSTDGATTWTRHKVAELGDHNPINLFPELTIDRGGNLYYTWSQTQGPGRDDSGLLGEQDVHYAFSTTQGASWSRPINLTKERNDSAVMPWLVAGDPGQVDIVYYKANNGDNSNTARPTTVWNVYFGQSQNALNTGANFNSVQISDHPNHLGGICTAGLACSGDRDLLDFFTVDIDHLGAAHVIWADDNQARDTDTRNKFSRQLSGPSVFKNVNISLQNEWPIRDHSVTDVAGDTYNSDGFANGSCPGMDVLGTSADRQSDTITIGLTLNSVPTAAKAIACSTTPLPGLPATGGVWGAEFWAATSDGGSNQFYIAYRDNPPDGAPRVEAGPVDNTNVAVTSLEFHPVVDGTLGGDCTPTTAPCTITLTVKGSELGIKPGAGLYSITGLSTYFSGSAERDPATRVENGNSEQGDAATAFDISGTGTTK